MLSILVAQRVDASEFGIFAVVVSTWIIITGSIRAGTGELLIYHHSHKRVDEFARLTKGAQSAAFVASILVGAVLVMIGLFIPLVTVPFCILALGLPALVAQDNNRFVMSANGTPTSGLVIDVLFVSLLVFLSSVIFNPTSLTGLMYCWVVSSWLAAVAGAVRIKVGIGWREGISWLRDQKSNVGMFVGDFVVANGVANSAVYMVALLGTVADAGAIRGSQVLLVPILLIMRGASVALGPQMTRYASAGQTAKVLKICFWLSVSQALAILASWLLIALMPDGLLRGLLGESTNATLKLFPFAAMATLALGLATVAMLGLKATGQVRASMKYKIWTAPFTVGLMVVGILIAGAAGSQIALASGEFVRTAMQWLKLSRWRSLLIPESRT